MASLWQNFIGPLGVQGGFSGFFELGLRFHTTVDQDIYALSYYATTTTTSDKPAQLDLWDHSTGVLVASTSAVGHTGSVGWQTCPLAAAFTAVAGHVYEVALWLPTGLHVGTSATQPPAVPGLAFDSPGAVQAAFGSHAEPTTTSGFFWAVDLNTVVSSSTGGSGGVTATPADVASNLADWLISTGDNLHQADGLPWLTKTVADAVKVVTDKLGASGSGNSLDWIASLWRLAGDLTDAEIGLLRSLLTRQSQITGASGGGGSAFFGPDGTQVSAGVEALLARSTNAQVGFPASPWELTAETDFDGCLAWAEPADLYAVAFSTVPPTIPDNGQCGVPVRYRLAWWTPLNGEFAQERHWIDFEKAHLVDPAGRIPGLLLQTYLGGTGHVEAWTLNV